MDLDGLLLMDAVARSEAYAKSVGAGYLSPIEARACENLPPVAGGESRYLQQQNWPLASLADRAVPDARAAEDRHRQGLRTLPAWIETAARHAAMNDFEINQTVECILAKLRMLMAADKAPLESARHEQRELSRRLGEDHRLHEIQVGRFFAPHPIGTIVWRTHAEDGTVTEFTRQTFWSEA